MQAFIFFLLFSRFTLCPLSLYMYPRASKIGNNSSDINLFYKHLFSTIIFVGFFLLVYFLVPVHVCAISTSTSTSTCVHYQYMCTLPVHAYILHSYRTQNSYMYIFNISNLFVGPKFCFISMQYAGIWLKFMGCGPYLLSVTFTISMQYFGSAINLSNHHVVRTWLCQRCFVYAPLIQPHFGTG